MNDVRAPSSALRGVFVPLGLLTAAVVAWMGFQTYQLTSERRQLSALRLSQDPLIENATKLRASLDAVASGTSKLASDGNARARLIVDELRRRGVTINPDGAGKSK